MNLRYKILSKTVHTIRNNEVNFRRDYEFNRKMINESIDIINEGLDKIFPGQKLTLIAKKFLSKNEDDLIQLRNWAIYYLDDSLDLKEFNNKLNDVKYHMAIELNQ